MNRKKLTTFSLLFAFMLLIVGCSKSPEKGIDLKQQDPNANSDLLIFDEGKLGEKKFG